MPRWTKLEQLVILLLVFSLTVSFFSNDIPVSAATPKQLQYLKANTNLVTVDQGRSIRFVDFINVSGVYSNGTTTNLTYLVGVSTANPGVATVVNGYINGISAGTTVLYCGYQDKQVAISVVVKPRLPIVQSLTLNTHFCRISEGDLAPVIISITPFEAAYYGVNWASSDSSVAVYQNGSIKALKEGTATITISSKIDNSKKDQINVIVQKKVQILPVELVLSSSQLTLQKGATTTLIAVVIPNELQNKEVVWEVESNPSQAINITSTGIFCTVTATGPGSATIKVTSKFDTTKFKKCVITVPINDTVKSLFYVYQNTSLLKSFESKEEAITYAIKYENSQIKNNGKLVWSWHGPYYVYQNNQFLEMFRTEQEAITYALNYDHTVIYNKGKVEWSWHGPYYVYQNNQYLEMFRTKQEAINYALNYDHTVIYNKGKVEWSWHGPYYVYQNNQYLEMFRTKQDAINYALGYDHTVIYNKGKVEWIWHGPYYVYQGNQYLEMFASLQQAINYAIKYDNTVIYNKGKVEWQWRGPYYVYLNNQYLDDYQTKQAAIDYAKKIQSSAIIYRGQTVWRWQDSQGSVTYIFYEINARSGDKEHYFYDQAKKRQGDYQRRYPGTKVQLIGVNNAKEFKQKWNAIDDNIKIDALEIILHGSVAGPPENGVGYLYFENDWSRLAAGNIAVGDWKKDVLISELNPKKVDFLYFSACNSGLLEVYNVGKAFKDRVKASEIVGWDGGVIFNYKTNEDEAGPDSDQPTWNKYVKKDKKGKPARSRQGMVWIKARIWDGNEKPPVVA